MSPDFSVAWRFTDPRYKQLPERHLERIVSMSGDEAAALWDEWVPEAEHVMRIGASAALPARSFEVDTHEPGPARVRLRSELDLPDETELIFFWSRREAARVSVGLFLRYWDDFCYPDDDNTVIVCPDPRRRVFYVEERFRVEV